MMYPQVEKLIDLALEEDMGPGDVTSEFFAPDEQTTTGRIVAREPGVLSGVDVAIAVFRKVDASLEVDTGLAEGAAFHRGTVLMTVTGSTRSILTAERTVLNFLQRLCGVATMTRVYVEAVKPYGTQGARHTERRPRDGASLRRRRSRQEGAPITAWASTTRSLVKDNHLLASESSGALQKAIDAAKKANPKMLIELEADAIDQVSAFLALKGVDIILLDNMALDDMRRSVILADGKVLFEASGGIVLDGPSPELLPPGVDRISCGALTHSVRALDLGMDFDAPLKFCFPIHCFIILTVLDHRRISRSLAGASIGHQIDYHSSLTSTNDRALALARQGLPARAGSARRQPDGRSRTARK